MNFVRDYKKKIKKKYLNIVFVLIFLLIIYFKEYLYCISIFSDCIFFVGNVLVSLVNNFLNKVLDLLFL